MLTLSYAQENGGIGLTQTKAFKRVFVHWAIGNFVWPGSGPDEMFQVSKVINEYEFPPLEVLHYLQVSLRLGSGIFRFPALSRDSFKGLPGMLADSLPDKFGDNLLERCRFRAELFDLWRGRLARSILGQPLFACKQPIRTACRAE